MAFVSGGAAEVARLRGHRRAVCANRTKVVTCEAAADVWKGEEISKSGACGEPKMGPQDVLKKLPHRYPFLLVDKVLELELGKSIVGIKNVTFNEPQFTGHFPERPIFPGVLMVEALAQLSGLLVLNPPMVEEGTNPDFFFGGIDNVRFRKPIVPGDTLVMEAKITALKERFGIVKTKARGFVDGKLAVEADLTLTVVKQK
eukprot:CAMPEP_0198723114 /NCGR_PEP_ID=MMETSP1475-20131203/669_1 /TAXON_ID= ORGANISM="Unidentified sp., Strain CCMP1999" /NCGR_SAMPLE_ID=MMETSP1475 /ASSEMBLY_ACC=CAM_ASM_001111 /LENGTH=200 /DNA_ID=CAMNT_0044484123 /DNA_START=137 /DNA_END=739 /DNA_ORIENTATION=-